MKEMVRAASFGGLFLSLVGTFIVWAAVNSFQCSALIWEISLALNLVAFVMTWILYLPFKNTDKLLGHGLMSLFMLFSSFWLFGFAMFYAYFIFAPMNPYARAAVLTIVTGALLYRVYQIALDIREAFRKNKNLFDQMYSVNEISITYKGEAYGWLQKARRERNPFTSIHAYAAMIVSPFVLILDRLLSPLLGNGHGVFIVGAFFAVPILLWGVELFVQTIVTMIYYPIKLQQSTGKPVLLKD
jgi:hypothetical protein